MTPVRSKDVAALAGVSVRALRHYHQIGLLPEPDRDPNGYRRYALPHVAQVLRIRHLASLGVSLDQMPSYLENPDDEASGRLLDTLDRDLEARIAVLRDQREQVARLRADRRRPDLPRSLDVLARFVGPTSSRELADLDRDAALVLAQATGSDARAGDLEQLGEALAALPPDDLARVVSDFEALAAEATAEQVEAVVRAFADLLAPTLLAFLDTPSGVLLRRTGADRLPDVGEDPRLNEGQARALRAWGDRLDEIGDRGPEGARTRS